MLVSSRRDGSQHIKRHFLPAWLTTEWNGPLTAFSAHEIKLLADSRFFSSQWKMSSFNAEHGCRNVKGTPYWAFQAGKNSASTKQLLAPFSGEFASPPVKGKSLKIILSSNDAAKEAGKAGGEWRIRFISIWKYLVFLMGASLWTPSWHSCGKNNKDTHKHTHFTLFTTDSNFKITLTILNWIVLIATIRLEGYDLSCSCEHRLTFEARSSCVRPPPPPPPRPTIKP